MKRDGGLECPVGFVAGIEDFEDSLDHVSGLAAWGYPGVGAADHEGRVRVAVGVAKSPETGAGAGAGACPDLAAGNGFGDLGGVVFAPDPMNQNLNLHY